MKELKIKNKVVLEKFLRVLAEESVQLAQEDARAFDVERMKQKELSSRLSSLSSDKSASAPAEITQEEDDDIDDLFGDPPEKKQKPADSAEQGKAEKPAEKPAKTAEEPSADDSEQAELADDEDEQKVTYTMIKDRLNTIRGGRSLKDEEIRSELKTYIANLTDNEKIALHTYLAAIAGILTASMPGDEAPEPSDPPTSIEMTSDGSKKEKEEPKKVSKEAPKEKAQTVEKRPARTGDREDTTPPIQVGKQQTEALRKKIQDLMKS